MSDGLDDREILEVIGPPPGDSGDPLDGDPGESQEVQLAAELWPVRGRPGFYSARYGGRPIQGVLVPGSREQVQYLGYIAAGAHWNVACELTGVKEETVRQWRALGSLHVEWLEGGEVGIDPASTRGASDSFIGLCSYFSLQLRKAEATGELALVAIWRKAALKGDWRAARDMLARRWPERWREQREQISTGDRGGGVEGSVTNPKPADLSKVLAALAEAGVTAEDFAIEATYREAEDRGALPAPGRPEESGEGRPSL